MNKNLLTFLWLLLFAINSHAQNCNLSVTFQKQTILCYQQCTGSATANVTGATGNIGYLWSNGATTQTINQLCVGMYTVTVTDAATNCQQTNWVNITQKGKITHTDYQIMVSCFGACDGEDSLHVAGGTPPYSYLWNTGATTAVITGLCAGTYSVTTTDANGCQGFCRHHVVSEPPLLVAIAESTPTCAGSCNGTVTVHASGGTKPYTYTWASGAGDSIASGLCAGLYHIVITDAHGCSAVVDQNVADINPDDNNACTVDACDPLTFAITHTPVIIDDNDLCTTDACDPLTGVSHTPVSIDDSNACTTDACDPITGVSHTPVNTDDNNACTNDCCNPANGNITHNPVNTDDNNVCTTDCCNPATGAITHNPVNINDNNPCTLDACDPINGITHTPSTPSCTITGNNLCYSGGSTQLCAPAGQGAYLWNNGATTQCINVNCAGTYTVTVTNSGGCSSTCSKCVTVSTPPCFYITGNNSICAGGSTQLCGPSGQYTYLWNNGATTQCITVTTTGNYSLTVRNAAGCSSTNSKCVTLSQPPNCTITINNNCNNNNNGCNNGWNNGWNNYGWNNNCNNNGWWNNGCWNNCSNNNNFNNNNITQLCAPNGYGYSYLWSTGSTSQCINATSGTYTVTVTNNAGCSSTCSYTITPPQPNYWGCTLGFWKNHTSIWNNSYESIPQCLASAIAAKGYSGNGTSSSSFRTTFGLTSAQMTAAGYSSNMTLIDALNQGGGGFQKLARQGTAALLNTCGLSGHYTYTASQVITNIHNAVIALAAEPLATQLADANEVSPDKCPSSGCRTMVQLGIITDENITATAYPNPFSSEATIQFSFAENTPNVSVEVFDASGRKVATLFNGNAESDNLYKLAFSGVDLPQGIYTYRINTTDVTYYNKLVLMK